MSHHKLLIGFWVFSALIAIGFGANVLRRNNIVVQSRETTTCEARQSTGPICESCELLATCVRHSNGWVNIPVESCDVQNGYYCNARLGACSNAPGPCHPFGIQGNFPCTSQGFFPDPYDCQKYHICYFVESTLVAATADCDNDKAFDTRTGQCSLTLQSEICTQRQYECPYVGYVAPWPTNPNIFYVCKSTINQSANDTSVIYPSLHRCNDGEIFSNFYCQSGSSNLPPGGVTTPSPDIDPNDPGFSVDPISCDHVGLMADMSNCRKYYYCSALNGTLKHLECPQGTYYRSELSACSPGLC